MHGDAIAWQKAARGKLAELTGYKREGVPSAVLHSGEFKLPGGLLRRRVYLRARSGVDVPVHLISSTIRAKNMPVMICLQGTNSGVHLSWGEVHAPDDIDKQLKGYDIAVQAAKRGYLAVAIEQSGFGERGERNLAIGSEHPRTDAAMRAFLIGRSVLGERCSDVSSVVDWLIDQRKQVGIDPAHIHIMGHSAGGSVAMYAAALDERIVAVLACGCLGFIRETIGRRRNDGQQIIPGILNWMETADIVGLIAPRAFVTVAGETDHIWPASGAIKVVEEAKAVYSALGASDRIVAIGAPGGHFFRPELSWRALDDVRTKGLG